MLKKMAIFEYMRNMNIGTFDFELHAGSEKLKEIKYEIDRYGVLLKFDLLEDIVVVNIYVQNDKEPLFRCFVDMCSDEKKCEPYYLYRDESPFPNTSVFLRFKGELSEDVSPREVDLFFQKIEKHIIQAGEIHDTYVKDYEKKQAGRQRRLNRTQMSKIDHARTMVRKARAFLESKMVGQDEYIKRVCYILMQIFTGEKVDTSFFIGKSGSGKTYAWELLCMDEKSPLKDVLGYKIIDATTITAEAYKGCNITQAISDIETARKKYEFFILIIDEFDKVVLEKSTSDYERQLQQSYLQILSHNKVTIEKNKNNEIEVVDFSNMPVILLGAFQNHEFGVKKSSKKTIGFAIQEDITCSEDNLQIDIGEELLGMGAMPELVGRVSCFFILNELGDDILKDKLKKDIIEKAKSLEKKHGVRLDIDDNVFDDITISSEFGARSLQSAINKIFDASLMYDIAVNRDSFRIFCDENNNIAYERLGIHRPASSA